MKTPRRRRRVGGLALAIPFLALSSAVGRADDSAIPALAPLAVAAPETLPDLPGIPTEAATPDRVGETVVDAQPGPVPAQAASEAPSPSLLTESPPAPLPGGPGNAAAATPVSPPPTREPAADDAGLIPTGGLRPLAGLPSPQGVTPSEQAEPPSRFLRRHAIPAHDAVAAPSQARTGAGHLADGAGKIACGFGKMLRGTGQIIGSGFHALGNATENLFGAGDHLMNRGGHRLFDAAQEVAPNIGTQPAAPVLIADPGPASPPRIVPSGPYPAPQSTP